MDNIPADPSDNRFRVDTKCTRGTGHNWGKMATFADRYEARDFVIRHKAIDAKFPVGHYAYRIVDTCEEHHG